MRRAGLILGCLVALNALLLLVGMGRGQDGVCRADVCVAIVFDVGGLGDKSFNDSAYRGLMQAKRELGVGVGFIEPGDGSDRESALRQLASAGYDLVIGVGFIFTDDIRKLAPEFPDVNFACVDYSGVPGDQVPDNLAGLRFREEEGSYLVGAIAGLKTETRTVGFVGGMDIPLIHRFEAGYRAGVLKVCPDCNVLVAYAGTEPKAFNDPVIGKELALSQFQRGADVIYHASGKTGTGVFNAAKDKGRWAIGTDSDQFEEAPCCVLTSMIKGVDVTVLDTARAQVEGRFESGIREFGLAEGGVDFVYDDNNRDRLPPELIKKVREIERAIIARELEVPKK